MLNTFTNYYFVNFKSISILPKINRFFYKSWIKYPQLLKRKDHTMVNIRKFKHFKYICL